MSIRILLFILYIFLFIPYFVVAQSPTTVTESKPFSHLSIATGFTTLGFTAEATTSLGQNFALRAGLSTFKYSTKTHAIHLDDPYGLLQNAFGQNVDYVMRAEAKNTHGHIVVDFFPFKQGILYFSGGFYFGKTKLIAKGIIANRDGSPAQLQPPYEWPELEFNGQTLDITNGILNAELTLGNTMKPYVGIGLGRAIPKRRLGVKMELGILFAGNYTLKQNGVQLNTPTRNDHNFEDVDSYIRVFKYYPIAKLQLNYRLF